MAQREREVRERSELEPWVAQPPRQPGERAGLERPDDRERAPAEEIGRRARADRERRDRDEHTELPQAGNPHERRADRAVEHRDREQRDALSPRALVELREPGAGHVRAQQREPRGSRASPSRAGRMLMANRHREVDDRERRPERDEPRIGAVTRERGELGRPGDRRGERQPRPPEPHRHQAGGASTTVANTVPSSVTSPP